MIFVFDIGGTMTKYGIYENSEMCYELIEHNEFPSMANQGGRIMIDHLFKVVEDFSNNYNLTGISISSAGQVHPFSGEVIFATDNIPGYSGMNLKKEFESRFAVPVAVDNDVNCFLLGEYSTRKLSGDILGLTLGTGIGGAIITRGELLRGSTFSAGEIGHIQLVREGLPCTCGYNGCFEQYASTKALKTRVEQEMSIDDLKIFFQRCIENDSAALSLLDQWIDDLTDGIKSLIHVLNPEKVIIGGAIAAQGSYLEAAIEKKLKQKIMSSFAKELQIIVSENGNINNLYGALVHWIQSYPNMS